MVIVNITGTFYLGKEVNLNELSLFLLKKPWKKRKFAAMTFKISKPKCTALIFGSGKVTLIGTTSDELFEEAAFTIAFKMSTALNSYNVSYMKISNYVDATDLGFKLDLIKLYELTRTISTYETELFPGLVIKFKKLSVSLLIFRSGKIILTGCKYKEQIHMIKSQLAVIFNMCKKNI